MPTKASTFRSSTRLFVRASSSATPPPPPPPPNNNNSNAKTNASSSPSASSPASAGVDPVVAAGGDFSKIPPAQRPFVQGELNRFGFFSSYPPVFHVFSLNSRESGVWSRGQALLMAPYWDTLMAQWHAQNTFTRRAVKRSAWLIALSILVGGIIKMYYFEGDGKAMSWNANLTYVARQAAITIKNNEQLSAALGDFIVDWPDSLFQRDFKDYNRAGMVFAIIGTRSRAIVTLEIVRSSRFSTKWHVAEFSVDLLDGRMIDALPVGAVFTTAAHMAQATLAYDVAHGKTLAPTSNVAAKDVARKVLEQELKIKARNFNDELQKDPRVVARAQKQAIADEKKKKAKEAKRERAPAPPPPTQIDRVLLSDQQMQVRTLRSLFSLEERASSSSDNGSK